MALLVLFFVATRTLSTIDSIPATIIQNSKEQAGVDTKRQRDQITQALYQIEAGAAQSGWTPDLHRRAGNLERDLGELTNAVAHWEIAMTAFPNDILLYQELASAYLELQRWPDAADTLTHLLEFTPDNSWAHFHLGLVKAAFDPITAANHLNKAASDSTYVDRAAAILAVLNNNPSDPLISMRVGSVLLDLNLWPYAELAFQHANDLNPPYPEALAYIGLARDHQGRDGSTFIEQAVTVAPQNAPVRFLQGLHLRHVGDPSGSLKALIQATVLDPQNPAMYTELSAAYRNIGDLPRAEYWLKMAVALSGNDPQFQELLAVFYSEESINLTSEGVTALGETTGLLPNNPDVKASFGWALHSIGESEAGIAEINAALELAPDNARGLYYKAQIELQTGNIEEAQRLFERLAQMESPYQEEVTRALERLGG